MKRTWRIAVYPARWAWLGGCLLVWAAVAQPITVVEAKALQQEFEQRYQRLNGIVEDLLAAQATLQKQLDALTAEVRGLRDAQRRAPADAVSQSDLATALETLRTAVNKQRDEDGRKVVEELKRINATVAKLAEGGRSSPETPPTAVPTEGYKYEIRDGDTLSAIVTAYREAGVKGLTVDQVLRANKGLKPELLIPGKTIFIPDPGKP